MSELVGAASLPHPSDGERGALIALAGLPSIGPGQLRRLVSGLGPVGALDAPAPRRQPAAKGEAKAACVVA